MSKKIILKNKLDYLDYSELESLETYNNKIWYLNDLKEVPLPDPQVLYFDGVYYIVGTCDRDISVIDCYTTTNFIDFVQHKEIYNPSLFNGWERQNPLIFAPEMYDFDGIFYLYYSAIDKKNVRRMSVVISDNPLGPFHPIINESVDGLNNPIFNFEERNALDSTIFKDDDNSLYMYYVVEGLPQHILGLKLSNPYTAICETLKVLIKPAYNDSSFNKKDLFWEEFRNNEYKITEAPFMLKSNGKYYLTYSANGCWNKYYNVCYAVSDSPLGNFIKPYEDGKMWTNLLMGYPGDNNSNSILARQWEGFTSGTAHHAFFWVGDELMIAYHSQVNRGWNDENWAARFLAIDHVIFDGFGIPFVNGPTYSLQPLPSDISGLIDISKKAVINTKNISNITRITDDKNVKYYNLDSSENEVIFGNEKSFIEFEFEEEYPIKCIVIYNSSFYEKVVRKIESIDFGNCIINDIKFNEFYLKKYSEFVFPNSAIVVELIKEIKTNKLRINFDLIDGGNINSIKIFSFK